MSDVEATQPVEIACPGWIPTDGTDACLELGCYQAKPRVDNVVVMTEEPIEWVRRDSDFIETLQDPKKIMLTLVERIFGEYSEQLEDITHNDKLFWMKKAKPEFMKPFLNYLVKNLDQAV
jgi:hypothetical protein